MSSFRRVHWRIAVPVLLLLALLLPLNSASSSYAEVDSIQPIANDTAWSGTWAMIYLPPGIDPQAPVLQEANRKAEAWGIPDTNDIPGDVINDNVRAWYVDIDGNRLYFPELHDAGGMPRPVAARGVNVLVGQPNDLCVGAKGSLAPSGYITATATAVYDSGGILPFAINEYWQGSQGHCPYNSCGEPYSFVRDPNQLPPFRTEDGGLTWVRNFCADPYNDNVCQGPYAGYGENYGRAFALAGADATPNGGSLNPRGGIMLDCRYDALILGGYWHELVESNFWQDPGACPVADGAGGQEMTAVIQAGGYQLVPLPSSILEQPPEYTSNWSYCWASPPNEDNCFNWPAQGRSQPYEVLQFLSGAKSSYMVQTMYDNGSYVDGLYAPGQTVVVPVYNGYVLVSTPNTAVQVGYVALAIVGYGNSFDYPCSGTPGDWQSYTHCVRGTANTVYALAVSPLVMNPEQLIEEYLPKEIRLVQPKAGGSLDLQSAGKE